MRPAVFRTTFWVTKGSFLTSCWAAFWHPKVAQNDIRNDMKNEGQKTRGPGTSWKRFWSLESFRLMILRLCVGGSPPLPLYNPRIVKIRKLQTNYLTRPWAAGPANFLPKVYIFNKKSSGISRNRSGTVSRVPGRSTCTYHTRDELRISYDDRVMII